MLDIFFTLVYIHSHVALASDCKKALFPDCVMVALQILVLTVGVRILLGERLKLTYIVREGKSAVWVAH